MLSATRSSLRQAPRNEFLTRGEQKFQLCTKLSSKKAELIANEEQICPTVNCTEKQARRKVVVPTEPPIKQRSCGLAASVTLLSRPKQRRRIQLGRTLLGFWRHCDGLCVCTGLRVPGLAAAPAGFARLFACLISA